MEDLLALVNAGNPEKACLSAEYCSARDGIGREQSTHQLQDSFRSVSNLNWFRVEDTILDDKMAVLDITKAKVMFLCACTLSSSCSIGKEFAYC